MQSAFPYNDGMPTALANSLVVFTFVVAAVLFESDSNLYYRSVQEDGFLEWATAWAFLYASVTYFTNAARERRTTGTLPWFTSGLGLFCLFVALEEISWGQRLLGYQAPEYFLKENFQQEFNLHNIVDTTVRKVLLLTVLLGYGVASGLVSMIRPVKFALNRWGIVLSPPQLIPAFLAMSVVYLWYPWTHTGEWVEFSMGLGFMFAATMNRPANGEHPSISATVVPAVVVGLLAILTIVTLNFLRPSDDEFIEAAQMETEALAADFAGPKIHTRCGIHKRIYTFMRNYRQTHLLYGEFSTIVRSSGNNTRANYLLDPWNMPYWLRHKCAAGRVVAFVYSFGPNRQRESSEWEILGDDVGVYMQSDR